MHYYFSALARASREPDKFIKTARNMLRGPQVDTYVVSWPKTGRTWLRVLLGKALADITGDEENKLLDTYALTKATGHDRVMFSHGGPFHLFDPTPYQAMRFNKERFGNKKIVFLTRDIRDTLVSSYFQENKRTGVFTGDMGDFVRDSRFGARKIVSFYNMWYTHRESVRGFASVTYENLHAHPVEELGKLLHFMGYQDTAVELLENAVEYANFGNMKQLEATGKFKDSMMRPGRKKGGESLKVRRGKIGGYVDYLDDSVQDYISQVVDEMAIEGCDWYFADEGSIAVPA